MTHRRIYAVQHRGNSSTRMVEATSRSQALRHVAELEYDVTLPDPKKALSLSKVGIPLEQAGTLPTQEAA